MGAPRADDPVGPGRTLMPGDEQAITARRRFRPPVRAALIATATLGILQVGQFYVLAERQTGVTASSTSFAYVLGCLFLIPSAVTLTAAVAWQIWKRRGSERFLLLLCALNIMLALHLALFAAYPCGWQAVIGLNAGGCS